MLTPRWFRLILLTCVLSLLCLARNAPLAHQAGAQAHTDDAELRHLVDQYFAAYAKKDLEGWRRLWSAKSPELASRQKAVEQLFADHEKIAVRSLTVRQVSAEGEKADLRVAVEMSAIEAKTGQPAAGWGKMNRALHCVKEEGSWKIWREVAAEEDLAIALAAAKTDEERLALLEAEQELMTVELRGALLDQGRVAYLQGRFLQAQAIFRFTYHFAEKIGDRRGVAIALNGLASAYSTLGDFASALPLFEKSLKSRDPEDKMGIASTLDNLGSAYEVQGDYDSAVKYHKQAITLWEKAGYKPGAAGVWNNLGIDYFDQGNYSLALDCYQKSLKLRETEDQHGVADLQNNMGNVYRWLGDYELAVNCYRQAVDQYRGLGNRARLAVALNNLGTGYLSKGDSGSALKSFQASLELRLSEDKIGRSNVLNNIGNAYEAQGDHRRALEYFEQSLKLREELPIKPWPENAEALNNIASVHQSQGDYTRALQFAEQSAEIARKTNRVEYLWAACLTAGKAHRSLNQPDQARAAFQEAIDAIENLRAHLAGNEKVQEQYFENKISPYHEMVELLLAQNQVGEALAYAERAKARVLLDVLRSGRVNVTKAMTAEEQEQERSLNLALVSLNTQIQRETARSQPDQARLSELKAQLPKARLDYDQFQTALYAAHPELKAQRGEVRLLKLEEAADLLPDAKSALLEYVVTEGQAYLFVLTKNSGAGQAQVEAKVYPLGVKRQALAKRAARFREQLAKRDLGFGKLARELSDLLLKPAREQLQGKTSIIVVPDAALWEFPFEALQPAAGRFLLEDYAISYAPSLSVLREMMKLRNQRPRMAGSSSTLLAVGNPAPNRGAVTQVRAVHGSERLALLPEAEKEARRLGQLYGAERSRVYVGAEAREERIKAELGSYEILHLATHGVLNDASPMYSHVVLSQADGNAEEDGLLEAWEIMKLDLKADLAILSACETARGRFGAGEGMIGLSWALFVAGCPTTVVSQWKVDSASTTELMLEFHQRLRSRPQNSRISKAEALRQAAIKLMQKDQYHHPFHWAGFVVIGDGF